MISWPYRRRQWYMYAYQPLDRAKACVLGQMRFDSGRLLSSDLTVQGQLLHLCTLLAR